MSIAVPSFANSKVLVVGDIILDRYWCGSVDRISPEAPVPIVKIDKIIERPGGAANVAVYISAMGAQSRLLGLVGIDEPARILKKKIDMLGIKWDCSAISTYSTVIKLRIISQNQQIIRLDFEDNVNEVDTTKLINHVRFHLSNYNVLVLSDYNKGSLNRVEEMIRLAHDMNVPILIDPKGIEFFRYKGATLLTPNMSEFEAVAGFCRNETILVQRAKEIINDYNLSALLITRSEQGMVLLIKNKSDPVYFPARVQQVCDVTGAGDIVIGALSVALSSGESLERSCFLASLIVGAVISKSRITEFVDSIQIKKIIRSYIHDRKNIPCGVLDENMLRRAVSLARDQGEKIVLTNGVFDILHAGHISYLTDAKKLGDRLIVAVNSDESTGRLKGINRPINTLEKRMFVLSALSVVDWVISFDEDTPVRLIKILCPDFLVKGGDYKIPDIAGNAEMLHKGGKVCVLNFKPGCSSSDIINIIKFKYRDDE